MISSVMPSILMSIWSAVMPSRGTRDLEIHVAEMVLVAEDVGQHRETVAVLHQSHGNARDRCPNRHASVHQGEGRPAYAGHGNLSRCSP